MHIEQTTIEDVLRDWQTADVSDRVRAGLRLCEFLTKHPQDLDTALLHELRSAGLNNLDIEDAANVAFHFNFINRLADAFDFPPTTPGQRRRLAKVLNRAGHMLGRKRSRPSFVRGGDGVVRPVELEVARKNVLTTDGQTEPALRQAIEAHAAAWFGATRPEAPVPTSTHAYIQKLTQWAYKITDDDIAALKQAGFDEQAIFELTFTGAFGAAIAGVELVFELLYGDRC